MIPVLRLEYDTKSRTVNTVFFYLLLVSSIVEIFSNTIGELKVADLKTKSLSNTVNDNLLIVQQQHRLHSWYFTDLRR
jgi:hypothetical protein